MQRASPLLFLLAALSLQAELPLTSLSLSDAESIALEYNKQLLIAKEETEQAKERRLQAVSKWLPALNYYGEFRDIEKKELFFNVFSTNFQFSHRGYSSIFQLNQPLFSTDLIFGLKSKQLESDAIALQQASTKNELLFAVRRAYYAVAFFEESLKIERENIDYLTYALKQSQGKLEAKSATPFEVNQSKVALANAISLYYLTLKDLKNARNGLILTLGIDPLLEPRLCLAKTEFPLFSIPEISLKIQEVEQRYQYRSVTFPTVRDFTTHIGQIEKAKELTLFSEKEVLDYLEEALSLRPDLKRSQLEVGVADQNLHAKQGTYFPQINSYLRYSYNDVDLGTVPFFSQTYYWAGGVTLSWNLFDSLLREHEIREARFVRQASRVHYDKDLQRIEVEIRDGLYQFEEAIFAYLSSTQAVYLAEQAQSQAQDKLEFGRIAPLEYRDSVNLLAQARKSRNRANYELLSAYYQLRYARGLDANR